MSVRHERARHVDLEQLRGKVAFRLNRGLYFSEMEYGLRRDLTVPWEGPAAKIPIEVRPLVAADLDILLPTATPHLSLAERMEITWRSVLAAQHPEGCYVAVDLRDGSPCYMQWLLGNDDRQFIRSLRTFPELKQDEALLHSAFTPISHRGLGIMSAAMTKIAEQAAGLGARYVLTFVDQHNIPSLKGCQRAGFSPHMLRHHTGAALGLIDRNRFDVLPPNDPRRTLRF